MSSGLALECGPAGERIRSPGPARIGWRPWRSKTPPLCQPHVRHLPVRDRLVVMVLGRGLAAACKAAGGCAGRNRRHGARAAGRISSRLRWRRRGADLAARRQARSGQELWQGLHPRCDQVHQFGQACPGLRGRRHRSLRRQRERGHFRRRRGREGNVHRLDFAREFARVQHRLLRQGEFADPIGEPTSRAGPSASTASPRPAISG